METIRIIRINFRKDVIKKATWKRKKILMSRIKEKMKRILKTENIKISNKVNEYIHAHSPKKLPYKFTFKIIKDGEKYIIDLAE